MEASSAIAQHIDSTGISKASSLRASDRDAFGPLQPTVESKKPAMVCADFSYKYFLIYE